MLVSPLPMLSEERQLRGIGVDDAFERTDLSEEALVITPFQRAANRLREIARGDGRHGSCGHGVGEAASDALSFPDEALRLRHLRSDGLAERLRRIQERKHAEIADIIAACDALPQAQDEISCFEDVSMPEKWIAQLEPFLAQARIRTEEDIRKDLIDRQGVVFEGAQGVLLDEWRGFHPYTTWSTCTFDNALDLLEGCGWPGDVVRLGVIRGYATRHGAGPFPTEDAEMSRLLPDADNVANDWQRDFRVGWLDLVAVRYAIAACGGLDALAVTCLDRLKPLPTWMVCDDYETDAGALHDLPLGAFKDLAHQEGLTGLLTRARPKFRRTSSRRELEDKAIEHAMAIAWMLEAGEEGLLVSTGPTRQDKTIIY
jgi:adenylosuccinate synthase